MEMLAAIEVSWWWVALALAAGVLLAFAEALIPSGGLLTVLAVGAFAAAIVLAFIQSSTAGLVTLGISVLMAPVILYAAIRVWPHTPVVKRLILNQPERPGTAGDLSKLQADQLVGHVGVTKTMLRPAGKMTLDGKNLDCITEGSLVDAGKEVRIVAVHGAKVVVRPVAESAEEA